MLCEMEVLEVSRSISTRPIYDGCLQRPPSEEDL